MNINDNNVNEKNEKPEKQHTKYYVALLVCLAAVSAAGWSTYKTVKEFIDPQKSSSPRVTRAKEKVQTAQEPSKTDILDSTNDEVSSREAIPYERKTQFNTSVEVKPENDKSEDVQAVWAEKSEDVSVSYPVENTVTKEFSDDTPVYSKTLQDWRAHEGTDFKAEKGSSVKSITNGVVTDIYEDPSYGNTVVISHDGQFTAYYCGLDKNTLVKKGNKIKGGEEIGTIDKIPCEELEEPHLHLCISKDSKFIDPLLVLEKES